MAEKPANLEECIHYTSSLICSIEDMDKLIMYTDRGCYDCDGYDNECNHYLNWLCLFSP